MGSQRIGHDWVAFTSLSHITVLHCTSCLNQDTKDLHRKEDRPAVIRRFLSAWSVGTLKPPVVQRSTVVRGYTVSTPLYIFKVYLTLIIYLYSENAKILSTWEWTFLITNWDSTRDFSFVCAKIWTILKKINSTLKVSKCFYSKCKWRCFKPQIVLHIIMGRIYIAAQ